MKILISSQNSQSLHPAPNLRRSTGKQKLASLISMYKQNCGDSNEQVGEDGRWIKFPTVVERTLKSEYLRTDVALDKQAFGRKSLEPNGTYGR
jgi:hypothetical protein